MGRPEDREILRAEQTIGAAGNGETALDRIQRRGGHVDDPENQQDIAKVYRAFGIIKGEYRRIRRSLSGHDDEE